MPDKGNVLVTGGAGYIGSHTCMVLARAGYVPVAYDNLTGGHRRAAMWGPLEIGDIADRKRLTEVIERCRPRAVMHFASLISVGESVEKPAIYYQNNVAGTLAMLDILLETGIKTIVFSGSAAVYGIPQTTPIPEDHPLVPVNPYGTTKLTVEKILDDYRIAYGIRYVSLRYFNAAGADPEGRIGESHNPETHLVPLVLEAATGRRDCVRIFGTDYDTVDGTCIRDYIHVCDLAAAHVKALEYLEGQGRSLAVNLGTGSGYSVRQVLETAARVTGRKIPAVESPRRPGDPPSLVASTKLARKVLGWTPRISDLETIVETAWNWHTKSA